MRVSCPECGAEYQFASSAIPPEGYDAQCTNCSTIFFVQPEVTGTFVVPPDPDRIVTVGCPACEAQYQFPAKDIPTGGYDAQCTQCAEVFFVSDELESDENRVLGSPEPLSLSAPEDPLPSPETVTLGERGPISTETTAPWPSEQTFQDEPDLSPGTDTESAESMDLGEQEGDDTESQAKPDTPEQHTMKVRLRDDERAALEEEEDPPTLDASDFEAIPEADASLLEDIPSDPSAMTMGAVPEPPLPSEVAVGDPVRRQTAPLPVMPEPLTPSDDFVTEDDVDPDADLRSGRRKWLRVVGAAGVAAALVGVGLFVFDSEPTESKEFLARIQEGRAALRDDTDLGYQNAVSAFRFALDLAPESAQAHALLGLAKVMRGANVQERGQFLVEHGNTKRREFEALKPQQQSQELSRAIDGLAAESKALLETGRKDMQEGFSALEAALKKDSEDAMVLEAAAVYYSLSANALEKSRDMLERSFMQRGLNSSRVDWKVAESPWGGLALGRIRAELESKSDEAESILGALVARDNEFHRARFQLAALHLADGKLDEARSLVVQVQAITPGHERAAVWSEHLARAALEKGPAPVAEAPAVGSQERVSSPKVASATEEPAVSKPAKKRKKKGRRRGRKRRTKRKKR